MDRAFTYARVIHPQAQSNAGTSLAQMYRKHENEKIHKYNDRILQVEKATFTPLIFSITGGMGNEAARFLKHLAEKVSRKSGQTYSDTIAFIRRRIRFDLSKTCVISLRAFRGKLNPRTQAIAALDLNLRPRAQY